ncbi:Suppressor of fused protein (SUFU) [compost metagenome]
MAENVLLELPNVRNTLFATVEQNEQTVYFYIWPEENLYQPYPIRACWVRNLKAAPEQVDANAMESGMPPLMPAANCNHPEGLEPFTDSHNLEIIWFEEDDGAALLQGDQVLAIIPGWSLYMEDPVAYSKECVSHNEQLRILPLENDNTLLQRLNLTFDFLEGWNDENKWADIQDYFLTKYEGIWGPHLQYFAIDNSQWPPMALARFKKDNLDIFITLGASIRPMPWVDTLFEDASAVRRIELAVAIDNNDYTEDQIMQMAQFIAGMADAPWKKISWLGEGHTIDSQNAPAPFIGFILSKAIYDGAPVKDLSLYEDNVNLLWAVPVYENELKSALSQANGGFLLLEQMIAKDVNWIVRKRQPIL